MSKHPKSYGRMHGSAKRVPAERKTCWYCGDDRCKLSKEEDEAKDNLIDKMKEAGMDRYETPEGLVVTVTAKANVKVKRKSSTEENGEEGNGDGDDNQKD